MVTKAIGLGFKPIDPKDIPSRRRKPHVGKYTVTVAQFVQGGAKAVEVETGHASTPANTSAQLKDAVRRMDLGSRVAVVSRQGRVFLLRTAA